MIQRRPYTKLRGVQRGWLKSKFHFVPAGMGAGPGDALGPLIAWNDDELAPHSGFPEHPHDNVEIVTFVYEGAITHQDSLGNKGRAAAGQFQVMSAGTGLRHIEANADEEPVRLFQIWLETRSRGVTPRWSMASVPASNSTAGFTTLASGAQGDKDALQINANARLLAARLKADETIVYPNAIDCAYLVPTRAPIRVNDTVIESLDGCLIEGEPTITISATAPTDVVLAELI
jgi:redox-sensitive bicupin YhaK (pirin superfamily)